MEKAELRALFENEYPGKEKIVEQLIKPIFAKAKDTILTDELELSEADKKQIKSFRIIAQVRGGFPITFADVEVNDSVALKRSRVNIQSCVRKVLENDSNAIIFFHFSDNAKEWRVSYCHRATSNKESTDAKRYTYLCGTEHACRTIAERFDTLKGLTTIKDEDMLNAFGVEPLSKEFFDQYREHYADLVEYISGKRFIKKGGKFVEEKTKNANGAFKNVFDGNDKLVRDYVKKTMGRLVFLHFLQKKGWLGVAKEAAWGTGDKNFIYNLFKNAGEDVKNDFLEQALEPLFFKTLNTDRGEEALAPKAVCGIYGREIRIPYLNGGLFEEDELDKKKVKFKKEHFETLLEFFNQYNFTIDETDPDDQEIGVDPEMLGKIFENLLEDNKDKGAFYTPKEIVQYMCRESLIAYLNEKTKLDARAFVINHEIAFADAEKADLLKALLDVKVCDPAVGSGAFPMGMLNELLACTQLLTGNSKTRSELKKHIVKNNIYGVDIEKGAVDIARLRFWLAIIVDEEEPIPLPNLDYKIMQGNSLLESYEGIDLSKMLEMPDSGEFDYNKEQRAFLKTNMDEYFDDNNHEDKSNKNKVIKALVYDLVCATCGFKSNSDKALDMHEKIWDGTTDFFLWHTWFNDVFNRPNNCNGFDIVIGNPPYFNIQTLGAKSPYVQKVMKTYSDIWQDKSDILFYFFRLAMDLSRNIICFITSNAYLFSDKAKKLRNKMIDDGRLSKIINFEEFMIFNSASITTCITIFAKNQKRFSAVNVKGKTQIIDDVINFIKDSKNAYKVDLKKDSVFALTDPKISALNAKIDGNNTQLRDLFKIGKGMETAANDVFCFSYYPKQFPKEYIRRRMCGEIINKYIHSEKDEYILYFEQVENFDNLPQSIQKHLNSNKKILCERATVKNEGRAWWKYSRPMHKEYYNLNKIWCSYRSKTNIFALDESTDYVGLTNTTVIFDTNKNISLKYLLALLNSSVLTFRYKSIGKQTGSGVYEYFENGVGKLPIPPATPAQQQEIITLVDKILAAKKASAGSATKADTIALEHKIDELVYKLYGLTDEEIAIVEGK